MFDSDMYKYRQRWELNDPILKTELMAVAHNYDPLYGYRHLTKNATNFGSKNSWYTYMRTIKYIEQDVYNSWKIEIHPTAENTDEPFHKPHYTIEVMMPEEFLDDKLFMAENTRPYDKDEKQPSFLVGANVRTLET